MKNCKTLKIMILIVVIIILLILGILVSLFTNSNPQNQIIKEEQKQPKEIVAVQNRNDFFTVANCVNKYITYLTTKEKEILYNYLDEEYKKEKNITIDNVYSHIETFDRYYKFKAKEMYVGELSSTISQYYVYGTLTVEATGDDEQETPFYISIKLDKANNTFSVIPNLYINK